MATETKVKIDETKRVLIIEVPLLERPTESSSGKTLVVATTHGNMPTAIQVQGRTLKVGVNAYIGK